MRIDEVVGWRSRFNTSKNCSSYEINDIVNI